MTFRNYLELKEIVHSSIIKRQKLIDRWLNWLTIPVEKTDYKDLMNYIDKLQKQRKVVSHINLVLATISHYYEYKNLPNVAINTRLKGVHIPTLNQPIKAKQLHDIYHNYTAQNDLENIILGLMIYQGLERSDFLTLEINDINLQKGTIYIPARTQRRSRILTLESHQILQLQSFLFSSEHTSEKAFSPYIDQPNHFNYLLQKLSTKLKKQIIQKLQINIVKLSHLRQSRIAFWVNQEGIRIAQYKAGFKRVLSAERYQKTNLQNLKQQINLHHPFK